MRSSFGGITADELVEHGLRQQLFGVPLPAALQSGFGFAAETGLDSEALQQCFWLANDIAPAVTRLVISDGLVGAGKASAFTEFLLGPRNRNVRRLLLQWQAPCHYAGGKSENRGRLVDEQAYGLPVTAAHGVRHQRSV